MSRRNWFLPETPDVLGSLRAQLAITIEGVDAFSAWARGEESAVAVLDDAAHRSHAASRALFRELRAAFVTPLEPEDLFMLSRGIARVLDYARDVVGEARVMATRPDAGVAAMGDDLAVAVRHLDTALSALEGDGDAAAVAADAAIAAVARLDAAYARGMADLLGVQERAERIGRRELYRRCERMGEVITDVAERVIYAIVKES